MMSSEDAQSQLAAPMIARGALIGVVAVESAAALAFDDTDEQILVVVAHLVGAGLDRENVAGADPDMVAVAVSESLPDRAAQSPQEAADCAPEVPMRLHHYVADGSTFNDGAYLIKGVAGRLLWKVAAEYVSGGRTSFTNREGRGSTRPLNSQPSGTTSRAGSFSSNAVSRSAGLPFESPMQAAADLVSYGDDTGSP